MHTQAAPGYTGYLIYAAIIAVVLFFRFRTMSRSRRLKLETLWVVPALYALITSAILYQSTPVGIQWLYAGIALLAGAGLGWRRGALMRINVDPETHALNQQASPLAMLFILVLIIVRQGLRVEATMGVDVAFLTDLAFVFALGMFSMTRLEMFLRARRLLDQARAAAA
jgi:hypothetical protein